MPRLHMAKPLVCLPLVAAMGCTGSPRDGVSLQAAGILAAVERTESTWTPPDGLQGAYEETVLCVRVTGAAEPVAGQNEPDPALLGALAAGGRTAVADSDCSIPEEWTPSAGLPFTVTTDGRTGLTIWVEPPNLDAGRITVGVNPWPMMEYFWDCTATRDGGAWVIATCEAIQDL